MQFPNYDIVPIVGSIVAEFKASTIWSYVVTFLNHMCKSNSFTNASFDVVVSFCLWKNKKKFENNLLLSIELLFFMLFIIEMRPRCVPF